MRPVKHRPVADRFAAEEGKRGPVGEPGCAPQQDILECAGSGETIGLQRSHVRMNIPFLKPSV